MQCVKMLKMLSKRTGLAADIFPFMICVYGTYVSVCVSWIVLGDIPKITYTGVSKSIPLHFLLIPRYCNSN